MANGAICGRQTPRSLVGLLLGFLASLPGLLSCLLDTPTCTELSCLASAEDEAHPDTPATPQTKIHAMDIEVSCVTSIFLEQTEKQTNLQALQEHQKVCKGPYWWAWNQSFMAVSGVSKSF